MGVRAAGEFLAYQARQEQERATWTVVRRHVPGLPSSVPGNEHETADRLALHLRGVVLDSAVVAERAREVEGLVGIQRADRPDDCPDGVPALCGAVQKRALEGTAGQD